MEKFDKANPYNPNAQNPINRKKAFITIIIIVVLAVIIFKSCFGSSSTVGKYTKEDLPENFTYVITKDASDTYAEKNQLYVQLSEKLTEGQITTLAEELYNTKEKQRRFFMFYSLKSSGDSVKSYWAKSDFDPELKIEIFGATIEQEKEILKNTGKVDGKIIGNYYEEEVSSSSYTVYESGNRLLIKSIMKNGQSTINELKKDKVDKGLKLSYVEDSYNGEYFILTKQNNLEFYNKGNEKFATAFPIK